MTERRLTKPAATAAGEAYAPEAVADVETYGRLVRIIERMHRRYLDVMRIELSRLGVQEISPVQALMLQLIGQDELSVRELLERGYFLGSNASYNLKILVEAGYVDRSPSQRDRRAARLRLSPAGERLYEAMRGFEQRHFSMIATSRADLEALDTAYRLLRRVEGVWSDLLRYSHPIGG